MSGQMRLPMREKCALFVVFITPHSAVSPNVQNEINFAIDEKAFSRRTFGGNNAS